MNVIAVDDERLVLEDMEDICVKFNEVDSFKAFSNPADALEYVAVGGDTDVAFLDIEMPVMSGLELAKRLTRIRPEIKIIFVTGFKEYAFEAFGVNAIGYVLKPFSAEMVKKELLKAQPSVQPTAKSGVFIKTFGYFDVFVDDKPVYFSSSKSKELLALLVDRRGGSVSTENAITVLWPDRNYDETVQSLFRKVLKSLRVALSDAGISDILIDVRNQRSADMSKFDCDYYNLLKHYDAASTDYRGEYMTGYAWAEDTKKYIDRIISEKN
ncbi:MAG: response regulator [Ruminococcaceae bacterium]|nr:response regulator [Oscillospiraceae bacterium]